MMGDWMALLAGSDFDVLQNDDGSWYVNQYVEVAPGDRRRDTIAEGLTKGQAKEVAKGLGEIARKTRNLVDRITRF